MNFENFLVPLLNTIIVLLLTWLFAYLKGHWKKQARRQLLQEIKIDAMIYALSQVNSGIGEVFKKQYHIKYHELRQEHEFANHES